MNRPYANGAIARSTRRTSRPICARSNPSRYRMEGLRRRQPSPDVDPSTRPLHRSLHPLSSRNRIISLSSLVRGMAEARTRGGYGNGLRQLRQLRSTRIVSSFRAILLARTFALSPCTADIADVNGMEYWEAASASDIRMSTSPISFVVESTLTYFRPLSVTADGNNSCLLSRRYNAFKRGPVHPISRKACKFPLVPT